MAQDFPVAPLHPASWLLMLVAPALVILGLLLSQQQTTPIPTWLPFLVSLVMIGLVLALRRRRISVDGHELVIAATFYTRRIPIGALDLDKARIINLAEQLALRIPGAKVAVLPEQRHMMPVESPRLVNQTLLEFLEFAHARQNQIKGIVA